MAGFKKFSQVKLPYLYTNFITIQANRKSRIRMSNYIARGMHKASWKPFQLTWTRQLKAPAKEIENEEKFATFIYLQLGVQDPVKGDTLYLYHRTYKRLPFSNNVQKKACMHPIAILHLMGDSMNSFSWKFYFLNMKRYPFWKGGRNRDEFNFKQDAREGKL